MTPLGSTIVRTTVFVFALGAAASGALGQTGPRTEPPVGTPGRPTGPGAQPGDTGPGPRPGETGPSPTPAPLPTRPPPAPAEAPPGGPLPPPLAGPAAPETGPVLNPCPETVTAAVALSVKEAVIRALKNNPDLDIQRLQVAIASAQIDVARGEFEPFAFAQGTFTQRRDPFFSANPFGTGGLNPITGLESGLTTNPSDIWSYGAGFRQKTPLGTSYEIRYDDTRRTTENRFALNPSWTPSMTVSITQPLLRGLGISVNRALVTVARENRNISSQAFRDLAIQTAFQVEAAYWAYVYTVGQRQVAEAALKTAQDLLEVNRRKLEAGSLAPIEVVVAESGVASRVDAVITARAQVFNARDRLMRLIEPPGSAARWNVDIIPLDAPRLEETPIDVEREYATALERRPDLLSLQHTIAADRARLVRAENDELPQLDLIGSWSELGLGNTHHNSHSALLDGGFYDWSVGLNFSYPLFNLAARGAADQERYAIRQDRKRVESLELGIVLDVRLAVRDVIAGRERIRATEKAVELAARQLDEEKKRLEVGLATNHDVLLFEQDLTQARTDRLKAQTDYEIAKSQLARVTATILERRGIGIRDAE
jgi:outer membrane protein